MSIQSPRLKKLGIRVLVVCASVLAIEGYFRYLHPMSKELTNFVFILEMSNERWEYLAEEHLGDALTEVMGEELVPTRKGATTETVDPEEDRPPYDKIRHSYRVVTNSDGFRDKPFPKTKAAGTQRIVVVGDSISYGKGLTTKQRYTDQLQAHAPSHVEVLNLSYPACGTVCMVAYLNEFLHLKPDLVLVQPSGNDVDHTMGRTAKTSAVGNSTRWLLESRSIQILSYWLYGDAKSGQIDEAVKATGIFYKPHTDALFAAARKAGAKVVIMSFPGTNAAWYGGHLHTACTDHGELCLGAIKLDINNEGGFLDGVKHFKEFTETELPNWLSDSADLMDLSPDVLGELFPNRQLFMDIVHPNRVANVLAANQLTDFLKKNWAGWQSP